MPPSPATLTEIRGLLRRLGLELAFVDPAAGGGLLGDLATTLRDAVAAADPPAALQAAVEAGVEASESPPADGRAWFCRWHEWLEEAVTAWEQRRAPPPWTDAPAARGPSAASVPAGPAGPAAPRWQPPTDGSAEPVAVLPPGSDSEMMRLFCAEAEELLGDIEQAALVLESRPDDAETLATAFRGFHTLKGNAAVMRLVVLQRLAHEVESLLDAARRGSRRLDRDAIDVMLAAADLVARAVGEMGRQLDGLDPGRSIPLPVSAVIDRVHAVLASPPRDAAAPAPAAASAPPAALEPPPLPPTPPPSAAEVVVPEVAPPAPPIPAVAGPVPQAPSHRGGTAGSVRVDTAKLDLLVDLVGELVIAQSMVVQAAEQSGRDDQLARSLGHLRGIMADLQRAALTMRMIPIRGTFQKMVRLVRDTAVQLGKEIRLVVEGEETELDRTVIEEIGDPLIHMLRNAADHGIESPAERLAAGKPATGTLRLGASHQGGCVVIEIADDGRGLDPIRIRAKAIERGLIPADAPLDGRETLELIFAPGFSTAEQVSDLSGRGVGMDVVRRNLERLRGKVEIESLPGRGTTFTITLPLTLAIIEGLIVAVGGQRFVIPTLAVRESFRPRPGGITTVHGRGELVDVRGSLVPLVRLGRRLGIAAEEDPARAIVVVLEAGHDRRCLLVDEHVGKQEVVIKSLGETFAGRTGFAGAAILGDGRVGLILDTAPLVRPGRGGPEKLPSETAA
jgi:two-component system chemotaxis sensor kinase CheA